MLGSIPRLAAEQQMKKIESQQELQEEVSAFHRGFKTVLLATASADGIPDASYSPYILDDNGAVCIFVSELAQHTSNLASTCRASLLWIADEAQCRNPFARPRLSLQCNAVELPSQSAQWERRLTRLQQAHGKTIEVLRTLPDFHLFALEAYSGNYVRGFSQAFSATGEQLAGWLRENDASGI
jgi:putative heme iron utilization protein